MADSDNRKVRYLLYLLLGLWLTLTLTTVACARAADCWSRLASASFASSAAAF